MALLIIQGPMLKDQQLSEPALAQGTTAADLQFTVFNSFNMPVKIEDVSLEDEPTANIMVTKPSVPSDSILQPGQSLKLTTAIGTGDAAEPTLYSFKVHVAYSFLPSAPAVGELQFSVVN